MHGFEITSWLESRSGGAIGVQDSALYQALHRMEGRGLAAAEWGVTDNNQRARYYRLTAAGAAHLAAETARWVRYAEAVTGVLTAPSLSRLAARRAAGARDEVDDEIRLHLQLRAAQLARDEGLAPEAARAE